MRNILASLTLIVCLSLSMVGCTEEQRSNALSLIQGAAEVSGALASMPLPPGMENSAWAQQFTYWATYSAGLNKALEKAVQDKGQQ